MAPGDRSYAGASEMSARELVEQASRDLEEQLDPIAGQPPATRAAQEAVAVNRNPLTPQEDVEQVYEWRAVPVIDDARVMAEEMRNLTEVRFFEYASTLCHDEAGGADVPVHQLSATQRGYVHLYRRKKRREYQEETDTMATLLFQHKMLMLKKEIDQNQVAVAEHRRANPDMDW